VSSGRLLLELSQAQSSNAPPVGPVPPITLRVATSELVVIETPDAAMATWFADLCSGIFSLADGRVSFLEHDWATVQHDYAAAMRGRIGRVFGVGGWIGFWNVAENILLPQLHHTHENLDALTHRATELACGFGLPGLPMELPRDLSTLDLARAASVRAFLGDPALLLLESPVPGGAPDLMEPLLGALAQSRNNGAAAIWFARRDLAGDAPPPFLPASQRLSFGENGLLPARRAAR